MAGVFPYRGPGNPVPGPLAPLPDYMSEEKLQEKGESVRERRLGPEAWGWVCACAPAAALSPFSVVASVKALGVPALTAPHPQFFPPNQVFKSVFYFQTLIQTMGIQ